MRQEITLHRDDRRIWPLPSESIGELPSEFGDGPMFRVFVDSFPRPHPIKLWEGACCNLFFPSARIYRWHPVSVIREILRWPCFDHISLEQAAEVFRCKVGYRFTQLSDDYAAYELASKYGLYCHSCKKIKAKCDWNSASEADHHDWCDQIEDLNRWNSGWRKYGVCNGCIAINKQIAVERRERQMAKDREFNRASKELSRERERKREALDASYMQQKKQQKEEKERRRVEMLAAYELVKELGLIDQVRQRETKHEAGKLDEHSERRNEKRPACLRKEDKGGMPEAMLRQ